MNPARRHDLIWTAGIAATTAVFLLCIARPQFNKVRELKQEIRAEHQLAREGRENLKELPRLQAEVDTLRHSVSHYEEQIPTQDRLGSYLERLASVAQNHALRAEAIEPGPPVRSHDLLAVPIVVRVHGPFRNVYGLLKDVMKLPRLTQVHRFDAKIVADHPGEVQAEMEFRVFYRAS